MNKRGLYWQQKEDEGKYGSTDEWGRGPGDKDHEEGLDTLCILHLGLYW